MDQITTQASRPTTISERLGEKDALLTSSEYQRAIGRDVDGHDRLFVMIDTGDAAEELVWHHR
jgi:hypothetical protein